MNQIAMTQPGKGPLTKAVDWLWRTKGKGLNSIPIRFAVMSLVMTSLSIGVAHQFVLTGHAHPTLISATTCVLMLSLVPSLVTFLAATKLANMIRALHESTQAVVDGDLNRPLDVDCDCEVGGLADSFRAMISRLNHNILRMNVLAYTDPVTQLPNRAVITHALSTMADAKCDAALMFIDLDGFKQVNDTLGHEAGDELLRAVSDRIIERGFDTTRDEIDSCTTTFGELCTACPSGLVFARFAGDEFVALIPDNLDRLALQNRAQQIIAALEDAFFVNGTEVTLSASIGIARSPYDTSDHEELLSFADLAMYAAKKAGKGRPQFFNGRLREIVIEEARVEAELRNAIEQEEILLHFQPKVSAIDHSIAGVEALARWQHPERGLLLPSEFIDIAEQRGLMPNLGNCVLHLAAKQARLWMEQDTAMPVSVNFSAAQFDRQQLVPEVLSVLDFHRVDPNLIEVEITESMVMADFADTRYRLRRLQEAGIKVAIDDFGTGFSNLSQLAELPCDVLKIDRSLTAGIGANTKSEAIITAIVSMAGALGHQVVAEGIETLEQMQFLSGIGCQVLQGNMIGQAMSLEELDSWIGNRSTSPVQTAMEELNLRLKQVVPITA
ncbi:EAL domain-containing protein [Altererythrobacter sp. GH1-8]|uniref:putative bifunctional diguanylate cyclase/phosphodiesterase n=1 Tax=Altererythrobacter sp. GH1-8 TaxID=3349333 RepID=UPI00374CA93E